MKGNKISQFVKTTSCPLLLLIMEQNTFMVSPVTSSTEFYPKLLIEQSKYIFFKEFPLII